MEDGRHAQDAVPNDDFGLDMYLLPNLDLSFQFPEELIEETEEYVTRRDSNGVLVRRIKQGEAILRNGWTTGSRMPETGLNTRNV